MAVFHFHSSVTSGSTSWIILRSLVSVLPRQSPELAICLSISFDGSICLTIKVSPIWTQTHVGVSADSLRTRDGWARLVYPVGVVHCYVFTVDGVDSARIRTVPSG